MNKHRRTEQARTLVKPGVAWRVLGPTQEILSCSVFSILAVEKEHIINGARSTFYSLQAPTWVNIVAVTVEDNLILVRQYRHGINDYVLELPAGMVTEGEDPALTAKRELLEETGFEGREIGLLGRLFPNPGLQNNECFTYCFDKCTQIKDPNPEAFEDLVVQSVPLETVDDLIMTGRFRNALSIAAIHIFRAFRNRL